MGGAWRFATGHGGFRVDSHAQQTPQLSNPAKPAASAAAACALFSNLRRTVRRARARRRLRMGPSRACALAAIHGSMREESPRTVTSAPSAGGCDSRRIDGSGQPSPAHVARLHAQCCTAMAPHPRCSGVRAISIALLRVGSVQACPGGPPPPGRLTSIPSFERQSQAGWALDQTTINLSSRSRTSELRRPSASIGLGLTSSGEK